MAKELTGLGKFTLWVLVPILVGVVGYAYVGPHIGGIGSKVPVVRNLGRELAKKVHKPTTEDEGNALEPGASAANATSENASPTNETATNDGTEFQRIRQEVPRGTSPKPTPPRERRAPLDRVD